MNVRLLVVIGVATLTFSAAVCVAVFLLLSKAEDSTMHATAKLAAALQRDDASAAPEGAAEYVSGVRAYFGPIRSARVIDAHNKGVNTGDSADTRSFYVADILLRTERGTAVIEAEYDNHSLANTSERVSAVYELDPHDVPGGALDDRRRDDLASAFDARGGRAADAEALSQRQEGIARLRCVQDARGDVAQMQQCAD